MAASDQEQESPAALAPDREKTAAELMRFLGLRPPARVSWDGHTLIVEAEGQVLPERPTVWAGGCDIIYRP
ncbi:MAG TPA: hypothetical protein VJ770_24795 [Stellaceae bacterium]|nr:hypothetical protein [Stellaceae bacterium]